MVNPATWWLSLALFVIASALALMCYREWKSAEDEMRRLRQDMIAMEDELNALRRHTALPKPPHQWPVKEPQPIPITKQQIRLAIHELRKWVKEDG